MLTLASCDGGVELSVSTAPDLAPMLDRVAAAAHKSLIVVAARPPNTFPTKSFARQIQENRGQGRQDGGGETGLSRDERDEAG